MIKAIIFDLDGTLLCTLEDLKDSTNFALQQFGYDVKTLDEIRNFVGDGVSKLIERAIPNGKDNVHFQECLLLMKRHYFENKENKTKPYNDILRLLTELKQMGIKVGIVSNKYDIAVQSLCRKYFSNLYDIAFGESELIPKKPSAKGTLEIVKLLGVTKEEVIFVGDSEIDIETANNADITCISVLWGYRDKETLLANNAEIVVNTPLEILDYLK